MKEVQDGTVLVLVREVPASGDALNGLLPAEIRVIGREATSRFFELLLFVVPRFSTAVDGFFPTSDPNTIIIESHGGGPTVDGGRYTQRYFSLVTTRDGQAFRMREYCNPFQTYKAFGKERWERAVDEIMAKYNKPWPASQAPDPISLRPIAQGPGNA